MRKIFFSHWSLLFFCKSGNKGVFFFPLKSQRALTVGMFSDSIFHKLHPHEAVMCLLSVKESVDNAFMAKAC